MEFFWKIAPVFAKGGKTLAIAGKKYYTDVDLQMMKRNDLCP